MSLCTNMRRRIVDYGKLKRLSTRKSKAAEPVQTSNSYIHWKLLVGWMILILLDSLANFRFEYLYPLIMFFRSIYDSYKYQGLIFCILFVCLVAYLDLLCWSVLTGPWLFLGASSCVWLEIMRSIGLDQAFSYSALSLWMLFLYVEVSHRLHSIPQHLFNVSRPFAAHCIGYPVVTMSFLIKHHITHIIRQRQQKKVAEENSVYFGILQKALPAPPPNETKATDDPQHPGSVEELSNNVSNHVPTAAGSVGSGVTSSSSDRHHHGKSGHKISPRSSSSLSSTSNSSSGGGGGSGSGSGGGGGGSSGRTSQKAQSSSGSRHRPSSGLKLHESRERSSSVSRQNQQQSSLAASSPVAEQPTTPTSPVSPSSTSASSGAGLNAITSSSSPAAAALANGDIPLVDGAAAGAQALSTSGAKVGVVSMSGKKQATVRAVPRMDQPLTTAQDKNKQLLESIQQELKQEKQAKLEAEATVGQLELEVKKLKADLHASCLQEEETSSRVEHLISLEKYHRQELQRLRTESESLQLKLSKLKSGKEHDQAAITELEKKLNHEADARTRVEAKLRDHQHAARNSWSGEEVKELKDKLTSAEKELMKVKSELARCEKVREELRGLLDGKMASMKALESEKQQLKVALADETRVKIEMFTALSEAGKKHREEINRKNREVQRLQRNLAEIMAILPAMGLPQPPPPTTVAAQQAQATSGGQRFSPTSPTGVAPPGNGGASGGSGFPQPGGTRPPTSSTP